MFTGGGVGSLLVRRAPEGYAATQIPGRWHRGLKIMSEDSDRKTLWRWDVAAIVYTVVVYTVFLVV